MKKQASSSTVSLERLTQRELDDIIRKHTVFLKGVRGGARAILKFKDISGLNFQGADLSNADFTGSLLLDTILAHGTFKGSCFFACDLRNANLEKGDFSRADFRGACLAGVNLNGAVLEKADFREGKIMERDTKGVLKDVEWEGGEPRRQRTILAGAKLRDCNLSGIRASSADFADADLAGVTIKDADLNSANLTGANLAGADMTGSNLSNTNLTASIMTGTVLLHTETGGANLKEALTEENAGKKFENPEKSLPDLLALHTQWVATAGKSGERLDLSGYDLRNIQNLASYPLTALKASRAIFFKQYLEEAALQSAILDYADFRDCNLKKADLRGSSLKKAMLARADLSGAKLTPLKFFNPDGSEWLQRANLSGANLRYALLCGADLSDCVLTGADLSNADLSGCDLRRTDLSGALLDGADLADCLMQDAIMDQK